MFIIKLTEVNSSKFKKNVLINILMTYQSDQNFATIKYDIDEYHLNYVNDKFDDISYD